MDGNSRPAPPCCEPDQQRDHVHSNVESRAGDPKARLSPLPSPKRSRRSADKRVVSIPIAEASGSRAKGASESAPPSDSWAWRKYGQKPIKGSPYPRGYYRCSSLKGCPARKQVERSRVDPGMLVVTYSAEHNHSWPLPKTSNNSRAALIKEVPDPGPVLTEPDPTVTAAEFSDLIADDPALAAMLDGFWYSDVGSNSSASPPDDTLLFGPMFGAAEPSVDDCAKGGGRGGEEEEEDDDALFGGLGELPEYSVVFRRSYVERQMAAG